MRIQTKNGRVICSLETKDKAQSFATTLKSRRNFVPAYGVNVIIKNNTVIITPTSNTISCQEIQNKIEANAILDVMVDATKMTGAFNLIQNGTIVANCVNPVKAKDITKYLETWEQTNRYIITQNKANVIITKKDDKPCTLKDLRNLPTNLISKAEKRTTPSRTELEIKTFTRETTNTSLSFSRNIIPSGISLLRKTYDTAKNLQSARDRIRKCPIITHNNLQVLTRNLNIYIVAKDSDGNIIELSKDQCDMLLGPQPSAPLVEPPPPTTMPVMPSLRSVAPFIPSPEATRPISAEDREAFNTLIDDLEKKEWVTAFLEENGCITKDHIIGITIDAGTITITTNQGYVTGAYLEKITDPTEFVGAGAHTNTIHTYRLTEAATKALNERRTTSSIADNPKPPVTNKRYHPSAPRLRVMAEMIEDFTEEKTTDYIHFRSVLLPAGSLVFTKDLSHYSADEKKRDSNSARKSPFFKSKTVELKEKGLLTDHQTLHICYKDPKIYVVIRSDDKPGHYSGLTHEICEHIKDCESYLSTTPSENDRTTFKRLRKDLARHEGAAVTSIALPTHMNPDPSVLPTELSDFSGLPLFPHATDPSAAATEQDLLTTENHSGPQIAPMDVVAAAVPMAVSAAPTGPMTGASMDLDRLFSESMDTTGALSLSPSFFDPSNLPSEFNADQQTTLEQLALGDGDIDDLLGLLEPTSPGGRRH